MKHLPAIAGVLLGLLYVFASSMFLFGQMPEQPEPPAGSPMAGFAAAFHTTGYMHFVKYCELIGGLLVMLPKARLLGLMLLAPITANIFAFHYYVAGGGFTEPLVLAAGALTVVVAGAELPRIFGKAPGSKK